MVKLSWSPHATRMVLGLATADQRRIVDAVGEFRWCLEQDAEAFKVGEEHCITASGYDVLFTARQDGVEVRDVQLSKDQP